MMVGGMEFPVPVYVRKISPGLIYTAQDLPKQPPKFSRPPPPVSISSSDDDEGCRYGDEEFIPMSQNVVLELCQGRDIDSLPPALREVVLASGAENGAGRPKEDKTAQESQEAATVDLGSTQHLIPVAISETGPDKGKLIEGRKIILLRRPQQIPPTLDQPPALSPTTNSNARVFKKDSRERGMQRSSACRQTPARRQEFVSYASKGTGGNLSHSGSGREQNLPGKRKGISPDVTLGQIRTQARRKRNLGLHLGTAHKSKKKTVQRRMAQRHGTSGQGSGSMTHQVPPHQKKGSAHKDDAGPSSQPQAHVSLHQEGYFPIGVEHEHCKALDDLCGFTPEQMENIVREDNIERATQALAAYASVNPTLDDDEDDRIPIDFDLSSEDDMSDDMATNQD